MEGRKDHFDCNFELDLANTCLPFSSTSSSQLNLAPTASSVASDPPIEGDEVAAAALGKLSYSSYTTP